MAGLCVRRMLMRRLTLGYDTIGLSNDRLGSVMIGQGRLWVGYVGCVMIGSYM